MHFKSNLEERVYSAIKASRLFSFLTIKVQHPWHKLFDYPKYENRTVDFYLKEYSLVLEVHGEQHRHAIKLHGDLAQREAKLIQQLRRDKKLINLCRENDYHYWHIWYDEIRSRNDEELTVFIEKNILRVIENA